MMESKLTRTRTVLYYKGNYIRNFSNSTIGYVGFEGLWEGEEPEDITPSIFREYGMPVCDWVDMESPKIITVTVQLGDRLNVKKKTG